MDVILLKPQTIGESTEVLDRMAAGEIVMLSFDNLDGDQSLRMLDMVTGAAYVLKGRISRMAEGAYMIAPNGVNVDLGGMVQEEVGQ